MSRIAGDSATSLSVALDFTFRSGEECSVVQADCGCIHIACCIQDVDDRKGHIVILRVKFVVACIVHVAFRMRMTEIAKL